MIQNYVLTTFRNVLRNKVFIVVNVLGMAIAIACCIIAFFNYDHNASFDGNHLNANSIYRVGMVREFQNELTSFGYSPIGLGIAIKNNVPDVSEVVRYSPPEGGNFQNNDEIMRIDVNFVDPAFFKVFTFEFIEGTGTIANKNELFISDELAMKLFGREKAVGRQLVQFMNSGRSRNYVVAGVFRKPPSNSSFAGEAYADYSNHFDASADPSFNENNWYYRVTLFVKIDDPTKVMSVQEQIKKYVENNNQVREDFIAKYYLLEPFKGMAVRDSYEDKAGTWTRHGSPLAAVIGVCMMAVLVLLIACFNLTNTIVAISSRRLREIGVRKVLGSTRRQLIWQFMGETAVICFAALVAGLVICQIWLLPAFNDLWADFDLRTNYWEKPDFVIFLVLTFVITSFIAGSYPALFISRFQAATILKGTQKFGGTSAIMRSLLCLQFGISLAGIVCSFAFVDNASYQRNFDLGFAKTGVVYTHVNGSSEFEAFRNTLENNPDVLAVSGTNGHLFSSWFNDPIRHGDKEIEVSIMDVGHNYLSTVGIELIEGRTFQEDSETDRKEAIIITKELALQLGLTQPIGAEIVWSDTVRYYVVGVVNDIYNKALWRKFDPVLFRYVADRDITHAVVRAPAEKLREVNNFMEEKWKELFPNQSYAGRFMDEQLVEIDAINRNLVIMFGFLGAVSLLLSSTGLFTLVSLNIIKKMKEIGVRKVLGASSGNILAVVNRDFFLILTLAMGAGSILGWLLSMTLMKDIWKYYQPVSLLSIGISVIILLFVSTLFVGYRIYLATKMNPASVLRTE